MPDDESLRVPRPREPPRERGTFTRPTRFLIKLRPMIVVINADDIPVVTRGDVLSVGRHGDDPDLRRVGRCPAQNRKPRQIIPIAFPVGAAYR